ncbi:MAG: hypothetical protein IKB02_02890 [Clostridia bacterium]|nr:hypothetical protein [Clostridia bacterium]
MEKVIKYIFRNLKYAGKNVFSKLREYLPFFVAFFVIQSVFLTAFVTTATNYQHRYEEITERYDYDILISDLDYNDYIVIDEKLYIMSYMKNRTFESYRVSKVTDAMGEKWQIYVLMRDGHTNAEFLNYYIYANENLYDTSGIEISYTPLNEYRNDAAAHSRTPSILLLIALTLISALSVLTLYNVQVNHDRFRYGIYMTYGAGFKRLISTSVFEMMIVAVVSLIPSGAFVYGISRLFYGRYGIDVVIESSAAFKVILASLLVATVGVYLPMKMLSRKTPMSLIIAEDNSNLISSPRSTRFVTGSKFLKIYEALGVWRFRKYYLKLLLSAVAFSAIFVCGIYLTYMNENTSGQSIEQLRFEAKKEEEAIASSDKYYESHITDLDFFYGSFGEMEGVAYVDYSANEYAAEAGGIILLTDKMSNRAIGDMTSTRNIINPYESTTGALKKYYDEGYSRATYMYKYSAYDKNMLTNLAQNYEIEGDVFSVLEDSSKVIVSESVMNSRKYSFDVGDKIVLCRFREALPETVIEIPDPFDTVSIVRALLENNDYEFTEYTVGAVIKDMPETEGYFTVGLSYDTYSDVIGQRPVPLCASVYLEPDVTEKEYEDVALKAKQIINYYGYDFSLTDTYGYLYRTLEREECSFEFGVTLSALVLMLSPLVWFYSQSLFYKKRSKEMYVLSAYGATHKVLRKIHMASGYILSAIAFVFTAILGVIASFLVFKLMNEWLPMIGFGIGTSYSFYISPVALAVCLLLSAFCGFLSSYLPYKKMMRGQSGKSKKQQKKEREET